MSRRTGQLGNDDYGETADETRERPSSALDPAEIWAKLVIDKIALKRLRAILASGARADEPLVYEVRAPAGSRHLLKWGCIEIRNVDGRVHVWPLPFASRVLEEPKA
jgi:hypothetical protein